MNKIKPVEREPVTPPPTQQVPQAKPEPPLHKPMDERVVRARTIARWLMAVVAVLLVARLLWDARPVMWPFTLGLILSYVLLPAVNRLNRRMPRPLAIVVVYVGGIALTAGIVAYIIPPVIGPIAQLIGSIPSVDQLQSFGDNLLHQYQRQVP